MNREERIYPCQCFLRYFIANIHERVCVEKAQKTITQHLQQVVTSLSFNFTDAIITDSNSGQNYYNKIQIVIKGNYLLKVCHGVYDHFLTS